MDTEQENPAEYDTAEQNFAWQKKTPLSSKKYCWGSLLGVLLLMAQVSYFISYPLSQNTKIRPYLIPISNLLKIPLPIYRNNSDFTVIGSNLIASENQQYHVQISFINHADFPQKHPKLRLTLLNLQGGILAHRVFSSQSYQPQQLPNTLIQPNALLTIDFPVNIPNPNFSGYSIKLE